jgi:aspartokinase
MIELPNKYNIPVTIRNAYDKNGEFTIINDEEMSTIPTIFIVSDSIPLHSQTLLTIITTNTNIIKSLYEYCASKVDNNQIQLSTYVTPYLHTLLMNHSLVQDIIDRLHIFIEDRHETSS